MNSQAIPFSGGVITEGSFLNRNPGSLLLGINYEIPPTLGYKRIDGYTLYDGSESPQAIMGSGPVRSLFVYKDEVYAIRDNQAATNGVVWKATPSGWTQITDVLPAGGKYEIEIYNFYGASNLVRAYGVNGVGKAFEFDGTTVTFITTGMAEDAPTHLGIFRNFLFLSFPGGSVQHSSAGDPTGWNPVLGASELAVGDEVTSFSLETGDVLAIITRNKIFLLTGTGAIVGEGLLDWNLVVHSSDSGAIEGSIQKIGGTLFLNERGLSKLQASDQFGDFNIGTLSTGFRPLLLSKLESNIVCSTVVKDKNQYRLFFGDKTVLCCSFSGEEFLGATTFEYPTQITSIVASDLSGSEMIFGGDTEGNVYHMDHGTSFHEQPIRSFLRTQYYHYKSPSIRKRFRRIQLEIEVQGAGVINIETDYNYSDREIPKSIIYEEQVSGGVPFWDTIDWDEFSWASAASNIPPIRIQGVAFNMSILVFHESLTDKPFTLFGMIVDYDRRGNVR